MTYQFTIWTQSMRRSSTSHAPLGCMAGTQGLDIKGRGLVFLSVPKGLHWPFQQAKRHFLPSSSSPLISDVLKPALAKQGSLCIQKGTVVYIHMSRGKTGQGERKAEQGFNPHSHNNIQNAYASCITKDSCLVPCFSNYLHTDQSP